MTPVLNGLRERLEMQLGKGSDNAMLRFGLGNALLKDGDAAGAVVHLNQATQQDPGYSAAWKSLGVALRVLSRLNDAEAAWAKGVEVAQRRGDIQAAREMSVFIKRLQRLKSAETAALASGGLISPPTINAGGSR